MYAPELEVHKYLKERLSHFDFDTLYELHYLMITMGKVFCTKSDPRCSACPLRNKCEYACNGGKRFSRTVKIKKPRKGADHQDGEEPTWQPKTPFKSEIKLRSSGPVKDEPPSDAEPLMSDLPVLEEKPPAVAPAPKIEDIEDICRTDRPPVVHQAHKVQDIEDIAGTSTQQRRRMSINAVIRKIQQTVLSPTLKSGTPQKAPLENGEIEVDRILEIVQHAQGSIQHRQEDVPAGENGQEDAHISKRLAQRILKVEEGASEQMIRAQYRYHTFEVFSLSSAQGICPSWCIQTSAHTQMQTLHLRF